MKDYVHQGAYPLIVTALLAALFVLVTLRPGSDTASRPADPPSCVTADRAERPARRVVGVADARLYRRLFTDRAAHRRAGVDGPCRDRSSADLLAAAAGEESGVADQCQRRRRARRPCRRQHRRPRCGQPPRGTFAMRARSAGAEAPLDLCYLRSLGGSALVPLTELAERTPASPFGDSGPLGAAAGADRCRDRSVGPQLDAAQHASARGRASSG